MTVYNNTIETAGNVDNYYVYLTTGHTYYLELEGAATGQGTLSDPVLGLNVYPYDTRVAFDDDGGVGLNSRIVFTATQTAWYQVSMSAYGTGTGSYRLNFNEDDFRGTPEGVGASTWLGAGGVGTGTINYAGDRDVFGVSLTAGQTYHFEMQGSPSGYGTLSDPYLRLLSDGGAGAVLVADDDGGIGYDARIVYTPTTSGTYYLQAGALGDSGTGSYRIFAHADEYRDTIEGTGAAGQLATGGTGTASLQVAGDTDIWSTTLINGLTYTIQERGSPSGGGTLSDPYLALRDAVGNSIAFDDDGGTGNDSQITYTAVSTTNYYIEAKSFASAYAGTYTLSISAGRGTEGADTVNGTSLIDTVDGLGGNDTIAGNGGNDWLFGGSGNDILRGGAQNDVLTGGTGADVLIGGTGADRFDFNAAGESTPTVRDVIRAGDGAPAFDGAGAAAGDRIDLSGIDANALTGTNDTFLFGGTTRGHVWLTESGTNTILNANTDNDTAVEFQVAIEDGAVRSSAYAATDFIL